MFLTNLRDPKNVQTSHEKCSKNSPPTEITRNPQKTSKRNSPGRIYIFLTNSLRIKKFTIPQSVKGYLGQHVSRTPANMLAAIKYTQSRGRCRTCTLVNTIYQVRIGYRYRHYVWSCGQKAVTLIESSESRRERNRTKGSCNQAILDLCLPYNPPSIDSSGQGKKTTQTFMSNDPMHTAIALDKKKSLKKTEPENSKIYKKKNKQLRLYG